MTQGFFTVATGDEHYYKIAAQLLRSYRYHTARPLPFAIVADRENEYTALFDRVILLDTPANSYLDKLSLYDNLPFDIGVFVDADCLAYGDLNSIFDDFAGADDFCCYGRVLPLEDKTGWFNYEDLGDLQPRVSYCVGLHGGIYYIRKTDAAAKLFATARQIARDYASYKFKGHFATPGDEPIMALSMALHGMKPIPFRRDGICCYWEYENDMALDMAGGTARVRSTGQPTHLVHWGTRFTRGTLYAKQVAVLRLCLEGAGAGKLARCKAEFDTKLILERAGKFARRVKNKLRRTFGGGK